MKFPSWCDADLTRIEWAADGRDLILEVEPASTPGPDAAPSRVRCTWTAGLRVDLEYPTDAGGRAKLWQAEATQCDDGRLRVVLDLGSCGSITYWCNEVVAEVTAPGRHPPRNEGDDAPWVSMHDLPRPPAETCASVGERVRAEGQERVRSEYLDDFDEALDWALLVRPEFHKVAVPLVGDDVDLETIWLRRDPRRLRLPEAYRRKSLKPKSGSEPNRACPSRPSLASDTLRRM